MGILGIGRGVILAAAINIGGGDYARPCGAEATYYRLRNFLRFHQIRDSDRLHRADRVDCRRHVSRSFRI